MKRAIVITQTIKNQNTQDWVKNSNVGALVIKELSDMPNKFFVTKNVAGGYAVQTALQAIDGWKDVVIPVEGVDYDGVTQKLGSIFFSNPDDYYTYPIIDKNEQEIQDDLIAAQEQEKSILVQQAAEESAVANAQANTDDTFALNNQALYPMWNGDYFNYTFDFKCQSFTITNELVLYKCVQPHVSQPTYTPDSSPALFTRIAYPGQIADWIQPTGAQDAYELEIEVKHVGEEWHNRRASNVSEPGTDNSGWMQISNTPAPWYFLGNEGYPSGWTVTHNGQTWLNTLDNNFWEPGVSGWQLV